MPRVRRVLEGEAPYDEALWQRIADLGWLGAAIPEEYGGQGLGQVSLCAIAEELGRSLAPLPHSSSIYLCAELLLIAGSEAQRQRWLPELATGARVGTVGLAQGLRNIDTLIATPLRFHNDRLHGNLLPVGDGLIADIVIVTANAKSGPVLLLVDLTGPGISREAVECIDPSRPQAQLRFDNAAAEPLPGAAKASISALLDRAAVYIAFEQIGGAQRALDISCDYARMRHAFGRPIGSFQAIKHKLADMFTRIELARSNAYHAAWALETGSSELRLAASAARLAATEAYEYSAREAIQTHGGIGATWEADLHLFYRRSKLLMALLDTPPVWRNRLVTALQQQILV